MDDADYCIENHGSLFLLHPLNEEASKNLAEKATEEAQFMGRALAVEPRYIAMLVSQLREEGWRVR